MFVSSFKTKERYKLEALKKKQEQEEERMKKVEEEKRRKQDELKKSVPQSRITLWTVVGKKTCLSKNTAVYCFKMSVPGNGTRGWSGYLSSKLKRSWKRKKRKRRLSRRWLRLMRKMIRYVKVFPHLNLEVKTFFLFCRMSPERYRLTNKIWLPVYDMDDKNVSLDLYFKYANLYSTLLVSRVEVLTLNKRLLNTKYYEL